MTGDAPWMLRCVECGKAFPGLLPRWRCDCGETLDVARPGSDLRGRVDLALFDARLASPRPIDRSGVWRYRELVLPVPEDRIVTRPEGNTNLYDAPAVAAYCGLDAIRLKHEGENPTGSFKDRGMCVAITVARLLGYDRVACASTGNTSASMAAYAAVCGMKAFVFIPKGQIAYGKLAQSLAYGAVTLQIDGDFDAAMKLVEEVAAAEGVYLVNSVNPFRIEGQKAILFELLHDLRWGVPDWIALPGGNLGNSSAMAKALLELQDLGIVTKAPRIAVIQAAGANPLATAIRIGAPVSWKKSLRGVLATNGVVEDVTDPEILDAKAVVDRAGVGAEPASCAAVAGVRKLVARGVIGRGDDVCVILTGHLLKDPDTVVRYHKGELPGVEARLANRPIAAPADKAAIARLLR
jgi:threonine synthase